MAFQLNFGALEALLALVHGIADTKRTAFQARLKNFHRLQFPSGFATHKGKASSYGIGHAVEMALAVEMTQLGMPPDRIVRVLDANRYPTFMAVRMAAESLAQTPIGFDPEKVLETDPLSMFLYFDPAGLSSLMTEDSPVSFQDDFTDSTFFYGGIGVVRDYLVKWTSGDINRLSLINVTSMIDMIVAAAANPIADPQTTMRFKREAFEELALWAEQRIEETYDADDPEA